MLQKYEGDWESFIKSKKPFFIHGISENSQIPVLPNDIWEGVLIPQIDTFWDLLALGRVNKALNFLTRTRFHGLMLQWATPIFVVGFVRSRRLTLTKESMYYMDELLEEGRKQRADRSKLGRLHLEIYKMARDLEVIQHAYYYCADLDSLPAVPEAEEIVQGLRLVMGTGYHPGDVEIVRRKEIQYVWLPDYDDGMPLLERFDTRTVAAMIGNHHSTFRAMFFPHLIAQYILPTFLQEEGMTVEALKPFKALMRASAFYEYFHYLFRALIYLGPDFKVASRKKSCDYYKIAKFLESIGFDNRYFTTCRPGIAFWLEDKYLVEEEMWSVLRVAQHWGLDWKNLAKKTQHWCRLSQRIVKGEIPKGLHPLDLITPHDVFKVAFWHENTVSRPTYEIIDDLVVLTVAEEKRKRALENRKEQEKNRKRQKQNEESGSCAAALMPAPFHQAPMLQPAPAPFTPQPAPTQLNPRSISQLIPTPLISNQLAHSRQPSLTQRPTVHSASVPINSRSIPQFTPVPTYPRSIPFHRPIPLCPRPFVLHMLHNTLDTATPLSPIPSFQHGPQTAILPQVQLSHNNFLSTPQPSSPLPAQAVPSAIQGRYRAGPSARQTEASSSVPVVQTPSSFRSNQQASANSAQVPIVLDITESDDMTID